MRRCLLLLTLLGALVPLAPAGVRAEGEPAGKFDYYVMALSWSPTWCALEGDARNSPQCDRRLGWVLHGLWPQNERGWPSYCRTDTRDPSRAQTAAMSDIMGTAGSAWYQWKKHGRCAGLPSAEYFDTARRAYDSVTRPEVFRRLRDERDQTWFWCLVPMPVWRASMRRSLATHGGVCVRTQSLPRGTWAS